jgi:hypothetical protein
MGMFRIGQKVVCVDDGPTIFGDPSEVVKDAVYTVTKVHASPDPYGQYGISLAEIKSGNGYRDGFRSTRFRPVVERKTSIEIFQRMLNPSELERALVDDLIIPGR